MKKISEYDGKKLCQCFDCFNMSGNVDITKKTIKLKDKENLFIEVELERAKYLIYCGVRFAKVDQDGIIRVMSEFK